MPAFIAKRRAAARGPRRASSASKLRRPVEQGDVGGGRVVAADGERVAFEAALLAGAGDGIGGDGGRRLVRPAGEQRERGEEQARANSRHR